jgi:hypothetical protein
MTADALILMFANCCLMPAIFFALGYAVGKYGFRIRIERNP